LVRLYASGLRSVNHNSAGANSNKCYPKLHRMHYNNRYMDYYKRM